MSETDDLLAQAQAIQAQKLGQNSDAGLLQQAKKIQQQKTGPAPEQYSPMESRAIGALHGVTGGLSGAIAGAGNALGDVLGGGATQSSADESIGLRPDLAAKPSKVADYHPSYSEGMANQLATEKAAHDQNPFAYNSAEFAAGILPAVAGGSALKAAGVASPVAQGAALGAGLGESNYLGSTADPTALGAAGSATLGAGLGLAGTGIAAGAGKLLNPVARKLGQAGQSLFGESAQNAIQNDSKVLADNIVNSIKQQKKSIGDAYEQILNANKDKNIDLNEFVNNLKQRADAMDTSLPDQARDKKAVMDLIQNVTEGPESKQVIRFEPNGPTKTIPATPGAQDNLIGFGQRFVESQKQLGKQASFNIVPNEDNSLLTLVTKIEGENGPIATSKTIENNPGNEEIPFSQDINPIKGMVRNGGTITPNVPTAKTLRSNLGTLAYEKNLSNAGEDFAQDTYKDLTQTLKDQIPGLGPTDTKFTALLNTARKMGIKGNDEDVVRVLSKMTSDNQGKQIIVNQALDSLDKVNPEIADQIRNQSNNLDKKIDMVNQISDIGNFNVLNPKSLVMGLIKNTPALRTAAGNAVGLAEKTPAGNLVMKAAAKVPQMITVSPWSQKNLQNKTGINGENPKQNITRTAANLYNATPESLSNVANNLQKQAGMNYMGDFLQKAIDNNDVDAKNRAIFSLLQNPVSRNLLTPGSNEEKS